MPTQISGTNSLIMPAVTLSNLQIGSSPTIANNFLFSVPGTPDGSIRLQRGIIGNTTQNIITIDGYGYVSFNTDAFLKGDAWTALNPVPKQQLDDYFWNRFIVTSGVVQASGAGSTADVYPPSGFSMSNLAGFIPSIRRIDYAGEVDGNDTTECYANYYSDRVQIVAYNSEQRAASWANYVAIWKR